MPHRKTGRRAVDLGRVGAPRSGDGGKYEEAKTRRAVTFYLGGAEYAFDEAEAVEVLPVREAARVPNTPAFINGVLPVRGVMIPVIDLKKRLGVKANGAASTPRMVVAGRDDLKAGFLVDDMGGMAVYGDDSIEALSTGDKAADGFVKVVVRVSGRRITILSVSRLLDIAKQ